MGLLLRYHRYELSVKIRVPAVAALPFFTTVRFQMLKPCGVP